MDVTFAVRVPDGFSKALVISLGFSLRLEIGRMPQSLGNGGGRIRVWDTVYRGKRCMDKKVAYYLAQ